MIPTLAGRDAVFLLHQSVGAVCTCKGLGLGPEDKTHTQYIPHCFLQRIIAFEGRVGIDVSVYFHLNTIQREQPAKNESNINTLCHFQQHPLTNTHFPVC